MGWIAILVAFVAGGYALVYGSKKSKQLGGAGIVVSLLVFVPFATFVGAAIALRAFSTARVDKMVRSIGEDDE